MIIYKLEKDATVAQVTLNTNDPTEVVDITIEANNADELLDWLYYEHGRFGHLITDATNPVDLDSALSKQTDYTVTLIKGQEILQDYQEKTPLNRIT